jgi:hypothetical protein
MAPREGASQIVIGTTTTETHMAYLTLSDDNLLAEYVPIDKFKGVLEQRFAIGPDTLALLIRDGQIAEASAGGHFAVGGLWRTVKDAIAGKHALRLLIADLKPFQLTTGAEALTKDNVPVTGEFTIELQVDPEKPHNVLGFMKEHSAVTKASVLARFMPHLKERVLNAAIRRMDALELRGNVGLQDKLQADAMTEVERIASDLGMMARVVSVGFAANDEEKAQILKRQQDREQEMLDRDFQILNRRVDREKDATIFKLQTTLDVEKVKAATEAELRQLVLRQELDFIDAREAGKRVQQMKALQHELDLNRTQRIDGLKAQLENEEHAIEVARTQARNRKVALERELEEARHRIDLDKSEAERQGVARGRQTDDRTHEVSLARIRGELRDVEMEIAKREREHDARMERLQNDIRSTQRDREWADREQARKLKRLEDEEKLAADKAAREFQLSSLDRLNEIERRKREGDVHIDILAGDAVHKRVMDTARLQSDTDLSKIQMMKDATPEQIMAINAGFSQAVANVLIEQAKARAVEGQNVQALLRDTLEQARAQNVRTVEQAQNMLQTAVTGNIGVAQGVGHAVAGRVAAEAGADPAGGTTECPGCHRIIPVGDRHCRYCGRVMRQ